MSSIGWEPLTSTYVRPRAKHDEKPQPMCKLKKRFQIRNLLENPFPWPRLMQIPRDISLNSSTPSLSKLYLPNTALNMFDDIPQLSVKI